MSFCDGCKWAMYMAFQFEVLQLENLGRDLPGEWMSADLGVQMTDDECVKLRKEYKRKIVRPETLILSRPTAKEASVYAAIVKRFETGRDGVVMSMSLAASVK